MGQGLYVVEVWRSHSDAAHSADSLGERSTRRRELYLTVHSIHKRQTSMLPAGFEPQSHQANDRRHPLLRPLGHRLRPMCNCFLKIRLNCSAAVILRPYVLRSAPPSNEAIVRWKIGKLRRYSRFFKAAFANFKADDSVPDGIPSNTHSSSLATRSSWGGLCSRAPPRILGVEALSDMFSIVCLQPRRAEGTTSAYR